ncbi:MAG: hypothetical protein IK107_05255 [Oscillospiraceae bacterium]|nr:hypothetical protein [Oscillospiraceae bacterium]
MSRENERRNNARRLAFALYERMNDAQTVARLATVLHYLPEQLRADIADLESYTAEKVAEDRSADAD